MIKKLFLPLMWLACALYGACSGKLVIIVMGIVLSFIIMVLNSLKSDRVSKG